MNSIEELCVWYNFITNVALIYNEFRDELKGNGWEITKEGLLIFSEENILSTIDLIRECAIKIDEAFIKRRNKDEKIPLQGLWL